MPVSRGKTVQQPPHELDLVIDFVNTLDLEQGIDELDGRGMDDWFADRSLHSPRATPLDDSDHRRVIGLREALRALMLANNGGAPDDRAGGELEQIARRGELGVHFARDGAVTLAPSSEDFAGSLARLLVPVAEADSDGTWLRVKACRSNDCRWAFYDRSRNRSGVWCEMAVCGNRTKVRAYRDRTS
jgi:predicted RNA-binding Zn ribbon-like protein